MLMTLLVRFVDATKHSPNLRPERLINSLQYGGRAGGRIFDQCRRTSPRTPWALMVRTAGLEPARPFGAEDFKSPASTGSATSAWAAEPYNSPGPSCRLRRSRIS